MTIYQITGMGFAIIAFAYLAWRYVLLPLYHRIMTLLAIEKKLDNFGEILQRLSQELNFNGGHSLKDMVWKNGIAIERLEMAMNTMANSFEHGSFRTNERGEVVEVNDRLCHLLGRTENELIGNNWITCIAQAYRNGFITEWEKAVQQKRTFDHHAIFKKEEEQQRYRVFASPKVSESKLIGYWGTITYDPPKV